MRQKYEKIENYAYEITDAVEQKWQLILQKIFARSQLSIFRLTFLSIGVLQSNISFSSAVLKSKLLELLVQKE